MRRPLGLLLAVTLVVGTLVVGPGGDQPPASAAGTARRFGSTPLEDVLHWAAEERRCGLTTNRLAALMLAPTYPETGAPATEAPSPMTLSRWDDQVGLHSFRTLAGQSRAFWHPGIGAWQFDSAGLGAPYTAAQRIDTYVIAARTAAVMADRWCSGRSIDYVWAPWYGCGGGVCRSIYRSIYRPATDRLVGVGEQATVGRRGGMTRHTCEGPGRAGTFTCWRVDPARAEGFRAFTAPGYGPAPISAPFYVYAADGREYRHWLRRDTGYQQGVWASRPLGANARTSLSWHRGETLTVVTPSRGTTWTDVTTGTPLAEAVAWAEGADLLTRPADGRLRPSAALTRATAVSWVWSLLGRPATDATVTYPDVPARASYLRALAWLAERDAVSRFPDGTFRPGAAMTRVGLVALLWRAVGRPAPAAPLGFTDLSAATPGGRAVAWAAGLGYLRGVTGPRFRPDDPAPRGIGLRWMHAARPFSDVDAGAPLAAAADWAQRRGVITPGPRHTLGAATATSRQDLARMLWATRGRPPAAAASVPDVSPRDPAVDWVLAAGLMSPTSSGTFRPTAGVTRAQLALILWKLAGLPVVSGAIVADDLDGVTVSRRALTWADRVGVVTVGPDGSFRPGVVAGRGDAVLGLYVLASTPTAWADPAGAPATVTFPR